MSRYAPKPLLVRVIYISVDYGPGCWKTISPDLEVIKSQGTHYYLDIPHISDVLNTYLLASR